MEEIVTLDFDFWQEQKKLNVKQAASLIFGVNPVDKKNHRFFSLEIDSFREKLLQTVRSEIHDAREIYSSGKTGVFDDGVVEVDIFELSCSELGFYFFNSLTKTILTIPIEEINPVLETFELDKKELVRWLDANDVYPEFFFAVNFDKRLSIKGDSSGKHHVERPRVQYEREAVLQELINDVGLDEVGQLTRLEVWNRLGQMKPRLFTQRSRADDATVKKFLDNQSLIEFKRGRRG